MAGLIARDARGRAKPFEPTAEQRTLVQNLAGVGCTQDEVLLCIPWGVPDGKAIDAKTLRRHFRLELDKGAALTKMRAKRKLQDLIGEGHFGALVFFLKTQCGWAETTKVEATGKDGTPLPAVAQCYIYLPQKDAPPEEQQPHQLSGPAPQAITHQQPVNFGGEPGAYGTVTPRNAHIDLAFDGR